MNLTFGHIMKTFGELIKARRIEAKTGLGEMGRHLNISASYLFDIEKGGRRPPRAEIIEEMARKLKIDQDLLFDLAAKASDTIPPDLPVKIVEKEELVGLIRTASERLSAEEIRWLTGFF